MDTPVTSAASPNSYLDFDGLANLRAQAKQDPKAALRQTAQQFEGLFLQQMMKSMREAVPKSDLIDSHTTEQFQSMFDKEVSVQMSKRNSVGLADMLVKAQGRHMDAVNNANHALNPGQGAGTAASGSASAGLPLNVPAPSLSLEHVDHPLKKMVAHGSPMTLRRVQSSYGSAQAGDSP
jgi:flagellar protein FlgJ